MQLASHILSQIEIGSEMAENPARAIEITLQDVLHATSRRDSLHHGNPSSSNNALFQREVLKMTHRNKSQGFIGLSASLRFAALASCPRWHTSCPF